MQAPHANARAADARVVAVLQARMTSERLPGKVLMTTQNKPVLELMLERVRRCTRLDTVVVATSVEPEDDPLEVLAT